ncbi:NADH-quinone oxidoreductase subunit L [Marinobacter orientalis]|uniref:Probable inorganic carbon transporter subunit DabB n=1 Tax=Marinobacter orientalis TaxID=1928859 RepID=A0A7Y0RET3_9GAMM|nr:NADH-quinone oxidoreductase subunit L [Marinobacter orientalis]NMT64949.1 NADH-quinone oxidoreductase subunit L [Marinobacter orientalis]TGX48156.1 NADH-quinone oxidoreductase subunit L [Marinobacter orientalis]
MVFLMPALAFLALGLWLTILVCLFAVALFSARARDTLKLNHCWRIASQLLTASMFTTVVIGLLMMAERSLPGSGPGLENTARMLGLYTDGIAIWMALMVAFIGWAILRFAENYLRGDPGRERFLPWFLTTIGCVLVLAFTNNLLVLAGAWVGVSLALHNLLTLYPDRPQARIAAVQKFIVSRTGDAFVIAGVLLLYHHYGTFRLPEMTAMQAATAADSTALTAAAILLALAAVLKCAQIPFHGWLLRVMEAPTPVSALLHAGVINLGGFLWLRLFPVFDGFTAGHMILLAMGGTTAVIAVITMMTHYSVKHALAWSTCAQMGFMLFEIGMGAYTLALLHLLAHSVYKAHSFLAAGRTVRVSAVDLFPELPVSTRLLWAGATATLASLMLVWQPWLVEGNAVFGALLVLAVASATMGMPRGTSVRGRASIAGLALLLVPVYAILHALLGSAVPDHATFVLPDVAWIAGFALLVALALLSLMVALAPRSRPMASLYRHFSQGLYLDLPFDQLTRRLASNALAAHAGFNRVPHHPFTMEEKA